MDEPQLLAAIIEIRDLIRLLAEPAIAERDKKLREDLKRIVGSSAKNVAAVQQMNGSRNQQAIVETTKIDKGQLSRLVRQLADSKLLVGDVRTPQVTLSLPDNFFSKESQ